MPKKRYEERVGKYPKFSTHQCIKQDLHFKKIKKIVYKDDGTIHVFARYSVEFVFVRCKKNANHLILKTVIKRNRSQNGQGINRRKKQCVTA